jgi:hypothetical protein
MTPVNRLAGRPMSRLLRLALDNPLSGLLCERLPPFVQEEIVLLRERVKPGKPLLTPAARHEDDLDGDWIAAVRHFEGTLGAGAARLVNLFQGSVEGGSLRGCNIVVGDLKEGEISLVNVLLGNLLGGRAQAINVLIGDICGGHAERVNAIIGNVHGGTLESVNLLVGNVHGGKITKAHIILGSILGGRVEADVLIGDVEAGDVRSRFQRVRKSDAEDAGGRS